MLYHPLSSLDGRTGGICFTVRLRIVCISYFYYITETWFMNSSRKLFTIWWFAQQYEKFEIQNPWVQNMKLNMHKLYAAYCISLSANVASVILYAHASFNRHKTCVNGLLYCRLEDSSVHWPRFISVTIDRPIFIKTDRPIFINFAIINLLLPMSRCVKHF